MVSIGDLRAWRPEALDVILERCRAQESALDRIPDALAEPPLGMWPSEDDWQGDSAGRARLRRDECGQQIAGLRADIERVRRGLGPIIDEIRVCQQKLAEVEALAWEFLVRIPNETRLVEGEILPELERIEFPRLDELRWAMRFLQWEWFRKSEIVSRLSDILQRTDDVDRRLEILLNPQRSSSLMALTSQRPVRPPPFPSTPEARARWWRDLRQVEKDRLLREAPRWLGQADGIPASVRDQINRVDLTRQLDELHAEHEHVRGEIRTLLGGNPEISSAQRTGLVKRLSDVERKINAAENVQAVVSKKDYQLLLFDTTRQHPHAVVVNGNMDTAKNVAVFVPGLGGSVEDGLMGTMRNLDPVISGMRNEADTYVNEGARREDERGHTLAAFPGSAPKNSETAMVLWMGYDNPRFTALPTVLSQDSAHQGADDLADFYRGITASRQHGPYRADPALADPHVTTIGHSYGSLAQGYALQQPGTGVDEAMLVGSPGVGVESREELRMPAGHVYALQDPDDPVTSFNAYGTPVSELGDVQHLSTEDHVDPNSPDGKTLRGTTGHIDLHIDGTPVDWTGYFAAGTTSMHNIGAVVADRPDKIIEKGS